MENQMDTTIAIGGTDRVGGMRHRMSSLLVAFALIAGSLLMVQHRAEAASAPVAAAIAAPAAAAQINIAAIVCPILLSLRNAFASTAFFSFVQSIFTQLLIGFGCQPSG
jgi:hypothetical protein